MNAPEQIPASRVRRLNEQPVRESRSYVLYWMVASRRPGWNFSLQHAAWHAARLGKPLLILEALRAGYRWASARIHRFLLDGMLANRQAFAAGPARHYAYVEPEPGAARGMLTQLAAQACMVISDDFPCFFLPAMQCAAAGLCDVQFELVDSNGLAPMSLFERAYPSAATFRRVLHRELPEQLGAVPQPDPLLGVALPALSELAPSVLERWPEADDLLLRAEGPVWSALPIDGLAAPSTGLPPALPVSLRGGWRQAGERLQRFLESQLAHYGRRNHPDVQASSGLSPWLHFGHIASHQIFAGIARQQRWSPASIDTGAAGRRSGWWGMDEAAEGFLDQLITWRELGFNMCSQCPDSYDQYASLPAWARTTLAAHADDPREHIYSLAQLAAAQTHDEVWNAAQRQLLQEGRIHNYLRMLWGKRLLQWTSSPQVALQLMLELNNRYALDGRDPNSISGIFWVLGRYDRPFKEWPVSGKVRLMTSRSTLKKLQMKDWLARFSDKLA